MSTVTDLVSFLNLSSQAATNMFDLVENGRPWERRAAISGSVAMLSGVALAVAAGTKVLPHVLGPEFVPLGLLVGAAGFVAFGAAISSFDFHRLQAKTKAVTALEERARAEPAEPQLAWDLARIKLESYLDRNLRQVSSIYYLTVVVMLFGMALISVGIWRAITVPTLIQPAGLAALAGVIVQIIGGTFLLIYRSTMAQAKDYVIVLERINAVGMSINILEGIESATEMRDNARVQLSTSLLGMYNPQPIRAGKARKRVPATGAGS